jgi:hypothetical protein
MAWVIEVELPQQYKGSYSSDGSVIIETPQSKVEQVVVSLAGPQGIPGSAAGSITFNQDVPSDQWVIPHDLGKFPNVLVVDSAGDEVFTSAIYPDNSTVVLNFSAPFSGKAVLS